MPNHFYLLVMETWGGQKIHASDLEHTCMGWLYHHVAVYWPCQKRCAELGIPHPVPADQNQAIDHYFRVFGQWESYKLYTLSILSVKESRNGNGIRQLPGPTGYNSND